MPSSRSRCSALIEQLLEDPLPRLVVHDEVVDRVALGRGVLGVGSDVEVQTRPVGQEHVAAAPPGDDPPEEVTSHLVGAQTPLSAKRARHAVLVLESEDPALHRDTVLVAGTE